MRNEGISRVEIAIGREGVQLSGDVAHALRFSMDRFFSTLPRLPSERCIDLLYIAAGIYAVDRLTRRTTLAQSERICRNFDLTIAVRDLQFWQQETVTKQIEELVRFLTDEDWTLAFRAAGSQDGENRHQHPLPLPSTYQPTRAALYSGGLDSAAGLANQLISGIEDYVLVTVGHQSLVRKKSERQIATLQGSLGVRPLLHSIVVTRLRGRDYPLTRQERTQRTRSLLFATSAIAVAAAFDIERIDVFENGVGSINVPLMTGALFGGLTTRGSHPTFLKRISELGAAVLERPVYFKLPFIHLTKAQMLKPLRQYGLELWAQSSRSCIHTSWRVAGKSHCGTCPACIERRQAFAAAGIPEADYYSIDVLKSAPKAGPDADYMHLYIDEARAWIKGDERPRRRFENHLRFTDVPQSEDTQFARLLTTHCNEVTSVFHH